MGRVMAWKQVGADQGASLAVAGVIRIETEDSTAAAFDNASLQLRTTGGAVIADIGAWSNTSVTGSYGTFHLRPRDLDWQTCLAHEVSIGLEPADLFRHLDLYGNTKTYFHVVQPHVELKVTAVNLVEVRAREKRKDRS